LGLTQIFTQAQEPNAQSNTSFSRHPQACEREGTPTLAGKSLPLGLIF